VTLNEGQSEDQRSSAARQAACCVKGCHAAARYTPVLHVAQVDSPHVSLVPLPIRLCGGHRSEFPRLFLTAQRRASMEGALRSHGRTAPDWSRTSVEFVGP
jgi:hypothetical protein